MEIEKRFCGNCCIYHELAIVACCYCDGSLERKDQRIEYVPCPLCLPEALGEEEGGEENGEDKDKIEMT